jgi:hypothetical protein
LEQKHATGISLLDLDPQPSQLCVSSLMNRLNMAYVQRTARRKSLRQRNRMHVHGA